MQWLSEQIGTFGGAAGFLAAVVGAFGMARSWNERRKAAIVRDTELAPTLLAERQRAEHQRDEVTGQFKQATVERDDCHKARAACEKLAKQCTEERAQDRVRADHERDLLHGAIAVIAGELDAVRNATDQAPGPYRATGEPVAARVQRSLSASNMPAVKPDATIPERPGYRDDDDSAE